MSSPSLANLRHAIVLTERIDALKAELNSILGGGLASSGAAVEGKKRGRPAKGSDFSADAVEVKPKRKKRKMSAEGRARIVAAQKARWLKVRKAQKAEAKA